MVFGKLFRALGLGKTEVAKEEDLSDTISISTEAALVSSICGGDFPDKFNNQDGFDSATDTGDDSSIEDSDSSEGSASFVQTVEVYSKNALLQFRAIAMEADADEVVLTTKCESITETRPSLASDCSMSSASSDGAPTALTPTAGSWVAAMQSKRNAEQVPDLEEVTRKACSILNKLTVEKFDSLFEQLVTCGISKPEHLEMLVHEVFNKATTQHHFIGMYAELCVRLELDHRILAVVEGAGQQYSFRGLLVNQCQMSFEQLLQPGDMRELSKDADVDAEYALKRKEQALGNIKLIGRLVVHRMVTSNVLIECCERLLLCRDWCPEALESLTALLTVAGKHFDNKAWEYHPRLMEVFSCMRKLSKDKSTPTRARFLLRDVLDLREAGWPHCMNKATTPTAAPAKLDEVRNQSGADAVVRAKPSVAPTASPSVAIMQSKRSPPADPHDEKVTRKACSILNKLTVEKFDSLYEQLATCGIRKPEHLEMLMREVFNKATAQHHFIAMYADLCMRLEQDPRIAAVVADASQPSFRWLLVNQCQVSFENLLQPASIQHADKDVVMDEEYALRRKQQALGNIKLIGQLIVRRMVTSNVLIDCSEKLLRCRDSCPEALESLVALLTVAGKHFDTKAWQYHPRLLEVFSCLHKLSKAKSTQARLRFLLRDVLDLRDSGWSHCTPQATTAPMKLDEVREGAAREGKKDGKFRASQKKRAETENILTGLLRITQMADASNGKKQEKAKAHRQQPTRQHQGNKGKDKAAVVTDDRIWSLASGKLQNASAAPKENTLLAFDVVEFRRTLSAVIADLASDRKVSVAVRHILSQDVPQKVQATEFTDIITRIVEERRGPIRRCSLSFAAGLAAAEHNAFDRGACLNGIGEFFHEVYPVLCLEIPRLPAIATRELLPTLRNVFSEAELQRRLPEELSSTALFQQALASQRPPA